MRLTGFKSNASGLIRGRFLPGRELFRRVLLTCLAVLTPMTGWADFCEDRVAAALATVLNQSAVPPSEDERQRMRGILMDLCVEAVLAGAGQAKPAAPLGANPEQAADAASQARDEADEGDDGVRIFGIEFEKADSDSAGNERLRKKR